MKVATIVGARPHFIKAVLVSEELRRRRVREFLIHTGQHYDVELSERLFRDLKLPKADINLGVGSGTHAEQAGRMMIKIEKQLRKQKPEAVIVYGDTNSTLAGALAAVKLHLPVVHIEAGERCFDRDQPEEINRVICDHISTINCCATKEAVINLKKEGISNGVIWTGDTMLDLLLRFKSKTKAPREKLPEKFILVTIHRAENTDDRVRLGKILMALGELEQALVWPVHPRAKKMVEEFKLSFPKNVISLPPVTYSEMLWLESYSQRVITDSGGVQKEAYWLGVPCLTMLSETPWSQTLRGGWNQLVRDDLEKLATKLNVRPRGKPDVDQFGQGKAAKKICQEVLVTKERGVSRR